MRLGWSTFYSPSNHQKLAWDEGREAVCESISFSFVPFAREPENDLLNDDGEDEEWGCLQYGTQTNQKEKEKKNKWKNFKANG